MVFFKFLQTLLIYTFIVEVGQSEIIQLNAIKLTISAKHLAGVTVCVSELSIATFRHTYVVLLSKDTLEGPSSIHPPAVHSQSSHQGTSLSSHRVLSQNMTAK